MRTENSRGRHRAKPRPPFAALLIAAAACLGIGTAGTYAAWNDSAVLTSGTVNSGTMDLRLDGTNASGLGTGYTKASIAVSGLLPGESRAFDLSVTNVGDAKFTWSATLAQAGTWTFLSTPISVQIYAGTAVTGSGSPRTESCSGSALGSAITLTSTATSAITTAQTLNPSTSQSVCLLIRFDVNADNTNQGKSGAVSMAITANQVLP